MAFRTSYSQNSCYISCPQAWSYQYQQKLRPITEGASLYFGTAVDAAVMAMLEGKTDYINIFKDRWRKAYQYGKSTPIFDNENIAFAHTDFDEYVLKDKDKDQLLLWAAELKLGDGPDAIETFKEISKNKKNPYKSTSDAELKFFRRACWLSLKRKGELLINAFKEQFYPKITEVVATQKYVKIEDPITGDVISGYLDMILRIEGEDKPVIFDLKTAAQPYTQDQIDLTEQLTLYRAMTAKEYDTDKVGYVVLCKNIPKESEGYCKECGYKKDGRHKTCNNEVAGARCEGEWVEKKILKPVVQVLVESKSVAQVEDLLQSYGNVILAMKNNIVYKNTSKCNNYFGSQCPYFGMCHKGGSTIGLKKG